MKFPLSWLKEYLQTSLSPEKIAETLTLIGIEVESMIHKENDVIFEVAITPNLAHAASLMGIARELAAVTQEPLNFPSSKEIEKSSPALETLFSVTIENLLHCPRYFYSLINSITVKPSPLWLKKRLEESGFRSVNNIVDITNYVLLECGHPLHAFDADTLKGNKVIIRNAKKGEKIVTLDGKTHFPTEDTLLICDEISPVAVAGIMGSSHTEVTQNTKKIFLEAAYFEPTQVRRASKRMGINTEASRHFERGTDPNGLLYALNRAVFLMREIVTFGETSGVIEKGKGNFPQKIVPCRLPQVNRILGSELARGEIEVIFKRLNFKIKPMQGEILEVTIPTYRNDIHQEIDLIEEIARFYGYDNLYSKKEKGTTYKGSSLPHHVLYLFEKQARHHLLGEGLQELLTCNLISPKQASLIAPDFQSRLLIKLLNPSSIDQSVLRPTLLPNMLQVVKYNSDHEIHSLAGFEIGRIHFKTKDAYIEPTAASIVLTGKRAPSHWGTKAEEFDFFDLKGMVENFLEGLKISAFSFHPSNFQNFHPGRQATLMIGDHLVGIMGEVHRHTLSEMGISQSVFFAELNLDDLKSHVQERRKMEPLPLFPSSSRDWTFSMKQACPISDVFQQIEKFRSHLLEEYSLLDVYIPTGETQEKRVTLHFIYRDPSQTISQKKVEEEHESLTKNVLNELKKVSKL